ncbi:MAG: ATP-dependent DNA helicase [Robiginitomaculum sp.]|nr:MAG: ATP-dependent DNA helicase [Robiginitomaculum sp.]
MSQTLMALYSHITAVLGATNTGKTHYAVERMLARTSGVIGLPLRLLAREVYDKIVVIKGESACALITGEEKITPPHARYVVCTVEAMPMDEIRAGKFACVIIDEVQMVEHKERGHIFTDKILHARGTEETLLLGSDTVRPIIRALIPDARFHTRERFSVLSYSGHTKLSRLPKRSVIVAFSSAEVYTIAELVRRNFGGCALVMGGLSPRTRNAQAELYQSGEVDYLVATDAIGMGLNLDADHVAFASLRKFDGQRRRYLYASEIAQIAGRAGRFRKDGTFGTTGQSLPIDDDVIGRIENHIFEPLQYAQWRNTQLDFSSLQALQDSLAKPPNLKFLRRIAPATDEIALERLIRTHEITEHIDTQYRVKLLWDVCQIPDFRNLGPEAHARLLEDMFLQLIDNKGKFSHTYIERNIQRLNYSDGNVEILASRLSSVRTWTYISHKHSWVNNAQNWIKRTRSVEDKLSDALHTKLVARFVDRRTSALLKGIGAKTQMDAHITPQGEVTAEGHRLGHLKGLLFIADEASSDLEAKAVQAAAQMAIAPELDRRLTQISGSNHDAFSLSNAAEIIWDSHPIAKLTMGEALLKPKTEMIGGEFGSPALLYLASGRIADFLRTEIAQKCESLFALKTFCDDPQSFQGARPLAHVLYENFGFVNRLDHLQLIKDTERQSRGYLRNMTAQFGYHHVFLRDMLKPAPARLISILFTHVWNKDGGGTKNPFLPPNGMASTPNDASYSEAVLNKAGYTRQGPRIIRFDMLARLAQMLMQAQNEYNVNTDTKGPKQFRIAQEMMALLGCGYEDFEGILKALGYKKLTITLDEKAQGVETTELTEFLVALDSQHVKPDPQTGKDTKPANMPKEEKIQTAKPPATKSQWEKPLNVYRVRPETNEDGTPIIAVDIDAWQRDFKKRTHRPKHNTQGESADQARGSRESGSQESGSRARRSQRADKFSNYANIGAGKGKRPSSGRHKSAPKKSWSAPKTVEESPFAALAGLQLTDKKPEKKKGK